MHPVVFETMRLVAANCAATSLFFYDISLSSNTTNYACIDLGVLPERQNKMSIKAGFTCDMRILLGLRELVERSNPVDIIK